MCTLRTSLTRMRGVESFYVRCTVSYGFLGSPNRASAIRMRSIIGCKRSKCLVPRKGKACLGFSVDAGETCLFWGGGSSAPIDEVFASLHSYLLCTRGGL